MGQAALEIQFMILRLEHLIDAMGKIELETGGMYLLSWENYKKNLMTVALKIHRWLKIEKENKKECQDFICMVIG